MCYYVSVMAHYTLGEAKLAEKYGRTAVECSLGCWSRAMPVLWAVLNSLGKSDPLPES